VSQVIGRAFVIVWPFARATSIPIPDTFAQPALQALGGSVPLVAGFALAAPVLVIRRRWVRARR
jgi:signal peptidase I